MIYKITHELVAIPKTDILISPVRFSRPGISSVLVNYFPEPSSVKIFFSHEKESKQLFSYHVEQKYIFP